MSTRRKSAAEAEPAVALSVDMIRCDGHGMCAWLFPERIWLDRWGYPVVDPTAVEGEERTRALRAVRACPRRALTATAVPAARAGVTVQR